MPRSTDTSSWTVTQGPRAQLLPDDEKLTTTTSSRRSPRRAASAVNRYLEQGLAASLAARASDTTRARVDKSATLDDVLDVYDEPWTSREVRDALDRVWQVYAGPNTKDMEPDTVVNIVMAVLPGLPHVVATEHTHGVRDSLWARFVEYDRTVDGVRSKPPFEREYTKLCRIVENHTTTMFNRDIAGENAPRFAVTVANMLAILGDCPAGSPVQREAFLTGFHRALMALFLTETRAMELSAIVIEASRLMVEAVNASVESQIAYYVERRPCLTCMLPCGIVSFRTKCPWCWYSLY
eukprot:m.182093 g.182093  ORF g.182093 m.182093 type:complete len:295 (+) comp15437_c0_seq1:267-1151(+)